MNTMARPIPLDLQVIWRNSIVAYVKKGCWPMAAEGYQGGGTVGGKWGCAFAALVGLPLFSGALIIASMGDCAPDKQCLPPWSFFAFATIVTSTVGWGVRAVINRCARGKAPAD